ncbi:MAG: hypothetical protein M1834_002634 [Cirrosporium novae-zelandiae]|nr:MAG: hypothetical protein M1834_002634 [Cirrosporium novae-zelandiae]
MSDESAVDDIPFEKPKAKGRRGRPSKSNQVEDAKEEVAEEEATPDVNTDEEDDDESETDAEVYAVEEIEDYRFDKGVLKLKVRWKGYPEESDKTWEPEENILDGAAETLQAFYDRIGGKPQPVTKAAKKRGRPSAVGSTPESEPKSKRGRKSAASVKSVDMKPEEQWRPMDIEDWETEVQSVDTIEKDPDDDVLRAFILWKNGERTQHDVQVCIEKCPKKLCEFFIQHLYVNGKRVENYMQASFLNPNRGLSLTNVNSVFSDKKIEPNGTAEADD